MDFLADQSGNSVKGRAQIQPPNYLTQIPQFRFS